MDKWFRPSSQGRWAIVPLLLGILEAWAALQDRDTSSLLLSLSLSISLKSEHHCPLGQTSWLLSTSTSALPLLLSLLLRALELFGLTGNLPCSLILPSSFWEKALLVLVQNLGLEPSSCLPILTFNMGSWRQN